MKKMSYLVLVVLFGFSTHALAQSKPFKLKFADSLPASLAAGYYSGNITFHTGGEFEFSHVATKLDNLWKESLYEFVTNEGICQKPKSCQLTLRSRVTIRQSTSGLKVISFRFIIESSEKRYEGLYINLYEDGDDGKCFQYADGQWTEYAKDEEKFRRAEKLAAGLWDFHKMVRPQQNPSNLKRFLKEPKNLKKT